MIRHLSVVSFLLVLSHSLQAAVADDGVGSFSVVPPAQQLAQSPSPVVLPLSSVAVAPVTTTIGFQELHRAVLGMAPPATKAPVLQIVAVAVPMASAVASVSAANSVTAKAASSAANTATNAANTAVAAASAATNAAASANAAASVAASATSAAASATSSAQAQNAVANAEIAAVAAANTAVNAAAAANRAANAAASANIAANAVVSANAAATAAASANAANSAKQAATMAAIAPAAVVIRPPITVPAGDSWSTPQYYTSQIQGLLAGLSFVMVVKAMCIAGNVLVQVSPFSAVRRWDVRGCTGEADPAPYVSIAFSGCQWTFYGIFAWLVTSRSGFLILVHSNILGALLGMYYVTTYLRNCRCDDSIRSLQKYLSAVAALGLLQVCAMSVLPAERALFLIGIISSFCSFINATSVLVTVPMVLRRQDSRSIPGPYAVANLLSSMVWSLCGYILEDPCVMTPNIFSTFCSAAALGLKVYYPSKEDEKLLSVEDGTKESSMPMAVKKVEQAIAAATARSLAKEFTPMKPSASKINGGTFPKHFVGAGPLKIPEAAAAQDADDCGPGGTW